MRRLGCFLLFVLLLTSPALAIELPIEEFGADELQEALPDGAQDTLGDTLIEDALDPPGLVSRLWDSALEMLGGILKRGVSSAAALLAVALLCGLVSPMAEGDIPKYVILGGVLAVAVVAIGDAGAFIGKGVEALNEMSMFSKTLLPCLTAAATASGAVTSAAAKYAATALFMDIIITAAQAIIIPLVYAYMAAAIAAAALDSPALDSAAALMKWLCGAVITLVMTAFTLYLSISGAVSGAADAATAKVAKSAISAALPVVGGIISDAASTVVAGAGLLRSAVGAFGMVAVAGICLAPFLSLGLQYLLYKAAAALAGVFADKRIGSLISALGGAFGTVLGVVGAVAIMLFISVISLIKVVGI